MFLDIDPINLHASNTTVNLNDSLVLKCNTTGSGNLLYGWHKDGKVLSNQSVMVLKSIVIPDDGKYTCYVTNGLVTKSKEIKIKVQCKCIPPFC